MSGPDAPVFAIAGMHRSGTSMAAGLLRAAGLQLGARLIGATPSNPHGHHEDTDFVRLHDAALASNGTDWTLDRAPVQLQWPAALATEADALVAARASSRAWGWKDPRTTLFLDAWRVRIPSLRVIVVFRDAANAVASLRKRRDPPLVHRFRGAWPLHKLGLPMTRDAHALAMWRRYNLAALSFADAHRDRCVFVDAARLHESWLPLRAWMRGCGAELGDVDPTATIDAGLFSRNAPLDLRLRARLAGCTRIEQALRKRAIA